MKREYPIMKGFNRAGIYRMKQFYETYKDNEIVAPLVRQISWTHNVIFYNRTLSRLIAFELKIGDFQPEYISKMDFYLETLDRKERK